MTKKRLIILSALGAVLALIVVANFLFGEKPATTGDQTQALSGTRVVGGTGSGEEGNGEKNQKNGTKPGVFDKNWSSDGGEASRIQGEQAPEPIYEKPKISEILPILSKAEDEQKESLFMKLFATPGVVKGLSEREAFNKVWPISYRDALKKIENLMIDDGYITAAERSSLDTDEEIFRTLAKILDYAHTKGWVAEKDFPGLRRGVTEVLPDIIKREKGSMMGTPLSERPVLPGGQRLEFNKSNQLVLGDLVDGLKYVLMVPRPALAGLGLAPTWNTEPDCYKDLDPYYTVPGVNLWDFCCNCGLFCSYGCSFIEDCGPYGAACNVPLGCLNLMCEVWPNAVWDAWWNPLPTGICGCG